MVRIRTILASMKTRVFLVLALAAGLLAAGCRSDSGSKEFIPGKGWRST
jgi:hypothetical protein